MFGYRIIHKDVLAALLADRTPTPVVSGGTYVTSRPHATTGVRVAHVGTVTVSDTPPQLPPQLPPKVADAVASWGVYGGAAGAEATRLMADGIPAEKVAAMIAHGVPADD